MATVVMISLIAASQSFVFSELVFQHTTTENFVDMTTEIGWIKFASCKEGYGSDLYALEYPTTNGWSKQELIDIAKNAVTVKILPSDDIPGSNENGEYAVTADICSNPMFAFNNGYELSWTVDMVTSLVTGATNSLYWIGSENATNRMTNSMTTSVAIGDEPRSISDGYFYHAPNNKKGFHIYISDEKGVHCNYDYEDITGHDITIWSGFDINKVNVCEQGQYIVPTTEPTSYPTAATSIPSFQPTRSPTHLPTRSSRSPTSLPTRSSTLKPTAFPSHYPSKSNVVIIASQPTIKPILGTITTTTTRAAMYSTREQLANGIEPDRNSVCSTECFLIIVTSAIIVCACCALALILYLYKKDDQRRDVSNIKASVEQAVHLEKQTDANAVQMQTNEADIASTAENVEIQGESESDTEGLDEDETVGQTMGNKDTMHHDTVMGIAEDEFIVQGDDHEVDL